MLNALVLLASLFLFYFQTSLATSIESTFNHLGFESNWRYLLCFGLSILFLSTPFPATIIVLTNGYIFGISGFLVSYSAIILTSFFLYQAGFSSKRLKVFRFSLLEKYYRVFRRRFGKTSADSSVYLSRFAIPFFFHNYCCGVIRYSRNSFLIMILLTEIPITLFLTIGSSEIADMTFQEENLFGYFLCLMLILVSLLIGKCISFFKTNVKEL